jgi:hypothetical protein
MQITIDYLPRKERKQKKKKKKIEKQAKLSLSKLTRGQVRSSKRKPLRTANLLPLEQIYMHQLIVSSCLIGQSTTRWGLSDVYCPLFTNPDSEYATSLIDPRTTSILCYAIKAIFDYLSCMTSCVTPAACRDIFTYCDKDRHDKR